MPTVPALEAKAEGQCVQDQAGPHRGTQQHTAAQSSKPKRQPKQFVTRKGKMLWLGLRSGKLLYLGPESATTQTQKWHPGCHRVYGGESCVPLVSPTNAGTRSSVVCGPGHTQQRPSLMPALSVHSNELPGRCCLMPCATTSISWRATTSAWSSLTTKRSW